APWHDGEVAEYTWTIPGVDDAWSIAYVARSNRGAALERVALRYYVPGMLHFEAHIDRGSMRPVHSSYGSSWRDEFVGERRYESGEVMFLLRRMPLSPGWHASIPVTLQDGRP